MLFDVSGLRSIKPHIAAARRLQDQSGVSVRDVSGPDGDAVFKRPRKGSRDLEEKSC